MIRLLILSVLFVKKSWLYGYEMTWIWPVLFGWLVPSYSFRGTNLSSIYRLRLTCFDMSNRLRLGASLTRAVNATWPLWALKDISGPKSSEPDKLIVFRLLITFSYLRTLSKFAVCSIVRGWFCKLSSVRDSVDLMNSRTTSKSLLVRSFVLFLTVKTFNCLLMLIAFNSLRNYIDTSLSASIVSEYLLNVARSSKNISSFRFFANFSTSQSLLTCYIVKSSVIYGM